MCILSRTPTCRRPRQLLAVLQGVLSTRPTPYIWMHACVHARTRAGWRSQCNDLSPCCSRLHCALAVLPTIRGVSAPAALADKKEGQSVKHVSYSYCCRHPVQLSTTFILCACHPQCRHGLVGMDFVGRATCMSLRAAVDNIQTSVGDPHLQSLDAKHVQAVQQTSQQARKAQHHGLLAA